MSVDFIGIIATQNRSEIRLPTGPVIDPAYLIRAAQVHETAGFDVSLLPIIRMIRTLAAAAGGGTRWHGP